jgi:NAD(P)H-dependent FMN reductase
MEKLVNKIVAVNFSNSPKSMQARGLQLMDKFIGFHKYVNLIDFDIPVLDSNVADGSVPESVIKFDKALIDADAYVFAVSEMMGGYCGTFKNAMDWLVVKTNFDKRLDSPYSISHKPMYSITFSPSYTNGGRHSDMMRDLLKQFNTDYRGHIVFNHGWDKCVPGNFEYVKTESEAIYSDLSQPYEKKNMITEHTDVRTMCEWLHLYEEWDKKWTTIEKS